MLLIKGDSVHCIITTICFCTEFTANGNLGCESDNSNTDFIVHERSYSFVNVSWIRRKERPKNNENLSSAMTRSMAGGLYVSTYSKRAAK